MRDRGLIEFDGTPKPKDTLSIDLKNMINMSLSDDVYVELLIKDFYNIMAVNVEENGIESYLLQAFIGIKARWNFKTIDMLSEVDDFAYAIGSYEEVQQAKGVFCSDSLDFIRTHKHYSLEEVPNWCDKDKLNYYLDLLQEIGCIKIKRHKMKTSNGYKTCSFYYIPTMTHECIDIMVKQYAKRMKYAYESHDDVDRELQEEREYEPRIKRQRPRFKGL